MREDDTLAYNIHSDDHGVTSRAHLLLKLLLMSIHCTVYNVWSICTVYRQCTYIDHTLYSVQCMVHMYSVQCTYTLTIHCTDHEYIIRNVCMIVASLSQYHLDRGNP